MREPDGRSGRLPVSRRRALQTGVFGSAAVMVGATDAYGNRRPGIVGDVTLAHTGPGTLIAANPLPLATLGGVVGGFIRSQPGKTGRVTVTAAHATLGRSSVQVTISPVARTGLADDGPKTTE
jgi:hypothetical protein